jgi:magnesium-transporting ATPase (P-type)
MNNINLLKTALSRETIFVLGLTLLGYCSVLSFEAGFAAHYKIYIGFIDIGMINIFENIMIRIFPPAFVAYLYALYGNVNISDRIARLIGFIIAMVILGYFSDELYSHLVYVFFFVVLFVFFIFFFKKINSVNASNLFFTMMLFLFLICAICYIYGKYFASAQKEFNLFNYDNKKYAVLRVYNNSIIANEIINDTFSEHILYIPSNRAEIIRLSPVQKINK